MTTKLRFPDISSTSIYQGKYRDWNPELRAKEDPPQCEHCQCRLTVRHILVDCPRLQPERHGVFDNAGKLTAHSGDTVNQCMNPPKRPPSPDIIRRFRATMEPAAGAIRVFYGKARDPHVKWAAEMAHGISTRQQGVTSGQLVNPDPNTLFKQKTINKKESIYKTHIVAPLGKSHDQRPGLPTRYQSKTFTFGNPTKLDSGAGGIVNPDKTYTEVEKESSMGHELYRKTHQDYDVGERVNRSYTSPGFRSTDNFGIPTPHSEDGRRVKRIMKWIYETEQEEGTKIGQKRLDDFRERTIPQLGKTHDPIKETLNVPEGHTFGVFLKADEYGAGDLIHNRFPGSFLRGQDRQRAIVAAIRHNLKKLNYHKFKDLLDAFKFYDKSGTGKISIDDLRETCLQLDLPVEIELLEQLMDSCDVNRDGVIDYLEFSNFLNWKDKLKSGFPEADDDADGDLVPKSPQNADSTPRRLQKQIDKALGNHHTSAQMINSVVGGVDTRGFRRYGIPTIRSDIGAPRIRRVCDRQNYGDESDACGLLNPSIFTLNGVYEMDLLLPRTREEIKEILENCGIFLTGMMFDKVYNYTADNHPKRHVSIEAFRTFFDEMEAQDVQTGRHQMAV